VDEGTRKQVISKTENWQSIFLASTLLSYNYYLGSVLLWTDEMTKKKQRLKFENFLISNIHKIQIVQNIAQLLSKGRFNQSHPCF
jgi:hypothetical protein